MTSDDEMRERLADASPWPLGKPEFRWVVADVLLPVVRAIAADELRAAAHAADNGNGWLPSDWLHARADSMDPDNRKD